MRILMGGLCAILLASVLPQPTVPIVAAAGMCEQLSSLALPGTTVTLAQRWHPAHLPRPRLARPSPVLARRSPACPRSAGSQPYQTSSTRTSEWRSGCRSTTGTESSGRRQRRLGRRDQLSGDGAALREGYATASTDTGYAGGDAVFGIGHPEKLPISRFAPCTRRR
jgi:feruloyl esterase